MATASLVRLQHAQRAIEHGVREHGRFLHAVNSPGLTAASSKRSSSRSSSGSSRTGLGACSSSQAVTRCRVSRNGRCSACASASCKRLLQAHLNRPIVELDALSGFGEERRRAATCALKGLAKRHHYLEPQRSSNDQRLNPRQRRKRPRHGCRRLHRGTAHANVDRKQRRMEHVIGRRSSPSSRSASRSSYLPMGTTALVSCPCKTRSECKA